MLSYLESTTVAIWVGESLYAYPGLLACHAVGLAIVVGIYGMRDLKLLGLFPDLNGKVFIDLNLLAICGFSLNAISGLLLFSSQASFLATSIPFLSKLSCVAIGMAVGFVLQRRMHTAVTVEGSIEGTAKSTQLLAAVSLAVWSGAIVAGRLIAYVF